MTREQLIENPTIEKEGERDVKTKDTQILSLTSTATGRGHVFPISRTGKLSDLKLFQIRDGVSLAGYGCITEGHCLAWEQI